MDILNLIEIRDQRTNKENKPNNKLNKIQLNVYNSNLIYLRKDIKFGS